MYFHFADHNNSTSAFCVSVSNLFLRQRQNKKQWNIRRSWNIREASFHMNSSSTNTQTQTHTDTRTRAREHTEVIISKVMTEKHQLLKRHDVLSPAEVSCEYVELRQAHKHALEATPLQYLGEGRWGRRGRKRKNKTPVVAPMVVVVAESRNSNPRA